MDNQPFEGSSTPRKQVQLGLSPVALSPTIRNGGNYRVAVEATPKTNSALALSAALKQGASAYGQLVDMNQQRAAEDVAAMSTEDFDKALQEGLDKDGRSLFGYTKAYNEALTQKYYAEEMPKKLQDISADLFRDPYAYKDTEAFEQAATAAIDGAYEEAESLLGDNVFAARAHNILKNKTRENFINKERAKYIEKLPEMTRQMQYDSAFRQFNDLVDFDQTRTTIEGALVSASAKLSRKDAASLVTGAYLSQIELAIENDEFARAEELLSQLDSEKGEGRRKFNGQELFNTASNRIKIEDLENKLEIAEVKKEEKAQRLAPKAVASLELEAFKVLDLMKDEDALDNYLTTLEAEIISNGTVTLGEDAEAKNYDDQTVVASVLSRIRQIRKSPDFFATTLTKQFIDTNAGQKRGAVRQLTMAHVVGQINPKAAAMLYKDDFDDLGKPIKIPTQIGVQFRNDFETILYTEENRLYDKVKHLPLGERELEYSRLYSEELTPNMEKHLERLTSELAPEPKPQEVPSDEELYFSQEEEDNLRAALFTESEIEEIKQEAIETRKIDALSDVFSYTNGNQRELRPNTGFAAHDGGISLRSGLESYYEARSNNLFESPDEQAKGFNRMRSYLIVKNRAGKSAETKMYSQYARKPLFRELDKFEKMERKEILRERLSRFGIEASALEQDKLDYSADTLLLSDVYSGTPMFDRFPILVDNSILPTLQAVQKYQETQEAPEFVTRIAETYEIPVDTIMDGQLEWFTTNQFIKN